MGTPQDLPGRRQRAFTAVAYLVLLVLGAMQGLIGSFQYSRSPVPLVAILLALVIFATCVLCGWGMRSFAGGLLPALVLALALGVLALVRSRHEDLSGVRRASDRFRLQLALKLKEMV